MREVYPGEVAQLVEILVQLHDLQLGFQVDLVIFLRLRIFAIELTWLPAEPPLLVSLVGVIP
jgi:hypothetical protein